MIKITILGKVDLLTWISAAFFGTNGKNISHVPFRIQSTSALPIEFLPDSHPHKLMINYSMIKMLSLHKIGCFSANNGPIWKIQNLAHSGPQRRSVWRRAWRDAQDDFTRARGRLKWRHYCNNHFGCYGPLPWAYLINCWLDIVHFRQANRYGKEGLTHQRSSQ